MTPICWHPDGWNQQGDCEACGTHIQVRMDTHPPMHELLKAAVERGDRLAGLLGEWKAWAQRVPWSSPVPDDLYRKTFDTLKQEE